MALMILLLFFGNSSGYFIYLRDRSTNLLHNFIYRIDLASDKSSRIFSNITNIANISDQNISLKQQISLLKYKIQSLESLEIENKQLKKIVNLVNDTDLKYVSARIITNIGGPYNYSATISAGADNGIKIGQIVINNHGLVGKITHVYDKTSSILLVSDMNFKIPVITANSFEKAIISGNNKSSA